MTASIKRIGGGGDSVSIGAAATYYSQTTERAPVPTAGAARVMDEYMTAGAAAAATPRWMSLRNTLVPDGAPIMPGELRKLLEGQGLDGTQLVQPPKRNARVGGWDVTFSAPKSVSALWATASPEIRTGIMDDLVESTRAALRGLNDRGVFETRRGKNGATREVVADVAVGLYPHVTSRGGDPQLHVHAVLINTARRQDGTTGTLDPQKLFPWKTTAGAEFRAELADRLQRRGAAILEDGQAFKVAGVPEALTAAWSKRTAVINGLLDKVRAELEAGARQEAEAATAPGVKQGPLRDFDLTAPEMPAGERLRKLKQAIKLATRQGKGTLPGDGDLERVWQRELKALGLTPEGVWQAARDAAARHQSPTDTPGDAAIGEALDRSAVVTERTLRRLVAEHAQTRGGGADGAHAAYDRLVGSGRLVALRPNSRGEVVYSTQATLDRERRMLLDAMDRRGEGSLIRASAAEAAIKARPALSEEQAKAVRHTARGDGVTVIEGVAGSGKSTALTAIADAAKRSGARIIGLAPSWKAAEVVRAGTALPSQALQGFVQGLDAGRIRFGRPPSGQREPGVWHLGDRVVLLVDEAGMASSRDTASLLAHAREGGAQVILIGDRRQLQAVEPGAPFAALADALGVSRMEEIWRQKTAPAWQLAASRVFAGGDSVDGLTRYDANGRVRWAENGEAAIKEVADAWERNRRQSPAASRLVLAARNADVHALNAEIRSRLLAGGELGADAITVRTLHTGGRRGGNGEVREMELRTGDRLALGVKLTPVGRDVLPNDLATLIAFRPGADPTLSLRIDRTGRTETLHLSELAPPARKGQEPQTSAPILQHAYAQTIHKAQAQTVDYTIVHAGDGLDAARAYVAMTRHRHDAVLIADAGAIRHRLAENGTTPTRDAVRQSFLRAAKGDTDGRNAGDYVVDRGAWLSTGDPHALPMTARESRAQAVVRLAAETADSIGQRVKALRKIDVPEYIRDALRRRRHGQAPSPAGPVQAPPPPLRRPLQNKVARPSRPTHRVEVSEIDAQKQFRAALDRAGFDTARMKGLPVLDGQRHSAPLQEDRGRQQRGVYRAWYDGVRPAGAWWNHRTGDVGTWKADGQRVSLSADDADRMARQQAAAVAQRARDQRHREAQGALAAQTLVASSRPASPTHPWLAAKGISADGILQDRSGRLVVPLHADGRLVNAETITADGTRRLQYGARKLGAHFVLGDIDPPRSIAIAGGLATAASFHAASGAPTVMAMDSSNLLPVAQAIRAAYPTAQIIFAADNDAHLPLRKGDRKLTNIGVEKAHDAALTIGNAVVLPAPELADRTAADRGTDWNDYAQAHGLAAARQAGRTLMAAQAAARARSRPPKRDVEPPALSPEFRQRRGPRMRM